MVSWSGFKGNMRYEKGMSPIWSCLVLQRSRGSNGIRGSSCLAPALCCRAMPPRASLTIHPAPCQLLTVPLQHSSSRHNPPSLGSRLSAIKIPAFLVPTPPPPHRHHHPLAAGATVLTSQCIQT